MPSLFTRFSHHSHLQTNKISSLKADNPLMRLAVAATASSILLVGCQSTSGWHTPTQPSAEMTTVILQPNKLDSFRITGKIGVTTPATEYSNAQSGSAFYGWGQDDDRFSIELTGALGIGYTLISYDGHTATLTSEKVGSQTADNPEELLLTATGWQAPISQLAYWISGHPAPSDSEQQLDSQARLATAVNGDWRAEFSYQPNETLPRKIQARTSDGHRVVMTILHQSP